jgi:hypothetical protein
VGRPPADELVGGAGSSERLPLSLGKPAGRPRLISFGCSTGSAESTVASIDADGYRQKSFGRGSGDLTPSSQLRKPNSLEVFNA